MMDWILKISSKWRKLLKKVYVESKYLKEIEGRPYLELWGQHKNGKRYKKEKKFFLSEEIVKNNLFVFAVFFTYNPFNMSKRWYVFNVRSSSMDAKDLAKSWSFTVEDMAESLKNFKPMNKKTDDR